MCDAALTLSHSLSLSLSLSQVHAARVVSQRTACRLLRAGLEVSNPHGLKRERGELVGSHGRWKRARLQTTRCDQVMPFQL